MKILICTLFVTSLLCNATVALSNLNYPKEGTQFKTLVIHFEENLNFKNPFDLETNKVELEILQPDQTSEILSFFYNGLNEKNTEKWEARFSPNQIGLYHFQIKVKDLIDEQFEISVEVNKEKNQGNLTLSDNLALFKFESGESFRGIEINICWAGFFSETPVIPLSWWWDNYIDKYDFWSEYKILSDFSDNIDWNSDKIRFKEQQSGYSISNNKQQAPSLVTCIYFGKNAALWFKNDKYQWSLVYEGKYPEEIEKFNQTINDLNEGEYSVSWFNPQTGKFFDKQVYVKVGKDGLLNLEVPAFTKDLACLVKLIN